MLFYYTEDVLFYPMVRSSEIVYITIGSRFLEEADTSTESLSETNRDVGVCVITSESLINSKRIVTI